MMYDYKYSRFAVQRSDGAIFFKKSRTVYPNIFVRLSTCGLCECCFPTITCDKCSYCV